MSAVGLALITAFGAGLEPPPPDADPPQLASTIVKPKNIEDFALRPEQRPTKLLNVVRVPIVSPIMLAPRLVRWESGDPLLPQVLFP